MVEERQPTYENSDGIELRVPFLYRPQTPHHIKTTTFIYSLQSHGMTRQGKEGKTKRLKNSKKKLINVSSPTAS
ncbi:CLUMA_CG016788, isoform A [Clunio marinus]|uniref:CLUMA_CG016788, isoform A n=1 Tax=Clunio marinus TaxID=568069 RepID=A0A1J1IVF6_9DIPT|nr:CLUMA_CG016788, isoform A [Clunio marinus]